MCTSGLEDWGNVQNQLHYWINSNNTEELLQMEQHLRRKSQKNSQLYEKSKDDDAHRRCSV